MPSPINKRLPELTKDELTIVLKNATYRGFNVNSLANEVAKNGVDKLAYNVLKGQVYIQSDDGKIKHRVKLNNINGKDHDWSLTRFFKMHVCNCCFDQDKYDARIDLLATELHNKIQKAEEKKQASPSLLSKKDFALMKTILKKQTDSTMVQIYEKGSDTPKILWANFNANSQAIQIRGVNNEIIEFHLGASVTCTVDGQPTDLDKIPADRSDWLMCTLKATIELSSNYAFKNKKIEIHVLKRGVEKSPADHLNKLSDALKAAVKTKQHPRLTVVLLKDNLSKGDGLDNGGISRDYLNSLCASLIENSCISFKSQKVSKLFMPVTTTKNDSVPGLTPMEQRSLNEIGRVMMFCYKSKPNTEDVKNNAYAIGQHFDDMLFEVALTLSSDELNKNFDELSMEVKAEMAKRVMEKFLKIDATNSESIKDKLALFELFLWKNNPLTQYNLAAAPEFAGEDFIDEDDGYSLDINKANEDPKAFVDAVCQGLLNEKCGDTTVAELIAPIFAIAQGLKSGCSSGEDWDAVRKVSSRDLNNKIQGSLDRNTIAASFQVITKFNDSEGFEKNIPWAEIEELNKKTQWLMNWIQNPKTDDEDIRKFLVYTTGSNSLPAGQKISICRQGKPYNPVPPAVTCKPALMMSSEPCGDEVVNDKTEAAFLEMLREQILNDTFFEINQD